MDCLGSRSVVRNPTKLYNIWPSVDPGLCHTSKLCLNLDTHLTCQQVRKTHTSSPVSLGTGNRRASCGKGVGDCKLCLWLRIFLCDEKTGTKGRDFDLGLVSTMF